MNYSEEAKKLLQINIDGLQALSELLDEGFDRTMTRIVELVSAGGKIIVTGLGKNYHIGQKMAATLTSTGTPAFLLHPSEAMHGDLGMIQPGDVVLAMSYSGESDEMIKMLPFAKRAGGEIFTITSDAESSAGKISDHILPIEIEKEACPFNLAPTTSTLVTLAIGDVLAMLIHQARGFSREDYAKLHPAGAIGNTLALKVTDVMRTGERVAKVSGDAVVKDAVFAMSKARAGAIAVTDSEDMLLGILTDGDIRRHIADGGNIAEMPVTEIMTTDPVSLPLDAAAADVMLLFEKHNIDDLVITDKGKLAGMVDLQDMPKMKLF